MDYDANGDNANLGSKRALRSTPRPSPLLLRAAEAAALCSASARTWRTWGLMGKIPRPIYIGRIPFWRNDELRAWVAAGCPDLATWDTMRG